MNEERRVVRNPYVGRDEYHCFACDPNNERGLNLDFYIEGDSVVSQWQPRREFEGYPGVIHGGILATLADEIAGWYLHAIEGVAGVTKDLSISYLAPARAEDGPFRIMTTKADVRPKRAEIEVSILGSSGSEFCRATCVYATFSDAVAKKRLHFPGREAFLGAD